MADYPDHPRYDIQQFIPATARHILDVGCGTGRLGAALKERQPCFVAVVEPNREWATRAGEVLDHVYNADVELVTLEDCHFDCIVLGDVLEHLRDPEAVLRKLRAALTDTGRLILSVPNVRHWSVVRGLLEGCWEYTDEGLLDRTHLRLFTRASVEVLLRRVGFAPQLAREHRTGDVVPGGVLASMEEAGLDVETLMDECRVYQYIYVATKAEPPKVVTGPVRIVVVAHNLWEQTHACLQSIAAHTPEPHEVVIVDNASDDETPDRVAEWVCQHENASAVRNPENYSYSRACNRGAEGADGAFVLLLNNDTVMTPGWLGRMLAIFERHPNTAIVGPMSNYVAGNQQVEIDYNDQTGMVAFAKRRGENYAGRSVRVAGVIGFCFLVRRDVWDELGGFDERYINGYEETDFCYQAVRAGHEVRVALDSFVHHAGSQTFREQGADPRQAHSSYWQLIEENWQRFRDKWQIPDGMEATQGLGWLIRRIQEPTARPRVFYAFLFERAGFGAWEAADAGLNVATTGGEYGYQRIVCPYTATDNARNHITLQFLQMSRHPDDVLVMLDGDHIHPPDIVDRLVAHPPSWGVVGALAFRRGPPHDPMFYFRDGRGELQQPAEDIDEVVYECDLVGSGAIAIRRWVFDRLDEAGYVWPYFRCEYVIGAQNRPGEEIYFGKTCEAIGIKHFVDGTAEIPHLAMTVITRQTWRSYMKRHPERVRELTEEERQQ